ncbi:MAG TPA: DinB family protein [Thermoanaerobaculia bacterium]|nr:DinB family protein [Thermoanaerobaculia bacterium]
MTDTLATAIPTFTETIAAQYRFNYFAVNTNLQDITDEESRRLPQPGGNPLNWILGHIIMVRQALITKLGGRPLLSAESTKAYGRGSKPDDALPESLPSLLAAYERSQEEIDALCARLTEGDLAGPAPFHPLGKPEASLATLLLKAVCHEAYHAGQLGIGRRLAGRTGAIQ